MGVVERKGTASKGARHVCVWGGGGACVQVPRPPLPCFAPNRLPPRRPRLAFTPQVWFCWPLFHSLNRGTACLPATPPPSPSDTPSHAHSSSRIFQGVQEEVLHRFSGSVTPHSICKCLSQTSPTIENAQRDVPCKEAVQAHPTTENQSKPSARRVNPQP